jgi:uncharacterized membrane protein
LVIAFLSFIVFVELVQVSFVPFATQFWGDEYFSLGAALLPNFFEIGQYMLYDGNGPIFNSLLWFWYRIVPYGDKYLLLLPQIFVMLSILVVGIASRKLLGNKGGIVAAILILININYILYGNELRTYSLTVFASAFMMWMYFCRLEIMGKENTRSIVMYGVSLAFLVHTHYCAVFICLWLFLCDIVLIIKNKIQRRTVFSYILASIIFMPWAIYYLKNHTNTPYQLYIPSITDIFNRFQYLNSNNQTITFICIAAMVFSVIVFFYNNLRTSTRLQAMFISCATISGFIFIMYSSSVLLTKYLNKGNFWVERYFLAILPFIIFVISAFFVEVIERIKVDRTIAMSVIIISILLFYLPQQYIQLKSFRGPTQWADWLESAANWLYEHEQDSIYESDTGVYYTVYDSWRDYSLEKLGRRKALNYVNINDKLTGVNKIYTVEEHVGLSDAQLSKLKEQFELIKDYKDIHVKVWQRIRNG